MRSSNTHLQPRSRSLVVEFKIRGPPVDSLLQVIDQPFSKRKLEREFIYSGDLSAECLFLLQRLNMNCLPSYQQWHQLK